jgi:hypothetical protein
MLVAQQDGLQAQLESLIASINAAKTMLQRLQAENAALQAQLGDGVEVRFSLSVHFKPTWIAVDCHILRKQACSPRSAAMFW